ncbi:MAG: uroporphyrinogen decarboxylase [Magnetococcales bacterium]|nr:uroporphyrinogen decarboxylase [Magnetococcales bacterium]MBF0321442.1 uroporphyrinogen decarboxylase [Magnetococcales bacterium]
MNTMQSEHPFLQAASRIPTKRTPIWIMRQAGRYLPEYRRIRTKAGSFMALCKNVDLATEVTLQPIHRFGLDAAILFSDILVVPEAMGMVLQFHEGEGPQLQPVLRSNQDLYKLHPVESEVHLNYVMKTILSIRKELDNKIPLIGFSGSPWTLATYMVEGGSSKNFGAVKGMMYDDPKSMHLLLDKLVDAVVDYLNAQIRHGAQAIQIFDTWGGILSPRDFREFSLRSMKMIVDRIDKVGLDGLHVPIILFAKGCGAYLEEMARSGCSVLGLDWTTDLGQARQRVGHLVALQGNMDPSVLYASPEKIRCEVKRLLEEYGAHAGHIFNLGHGMAPDMDPEKVAVLVDSVRLESEKVHLTGL